MDQPFITIWILALFRQTLGDTVDIPTVHGPVEMNIPAGTQTGKTFRLKGKGAPKLRGGGQGDQHVTVNIVTPTKLNDAQKEALRVLPPRVVTRLRNNSKEKRLL